jgi:uncharacterized protein
LDDDFLWDEANIDHIAAHGVTPTEAEDVILDPRFIGGQARGTSTERRYAVIGATAAGRILHVVYTVIDEAYRVITAYDANDRQKHRYRRGRK